ncbi:MAG: hypothetical protein ACXWID_18010 [Pyrinomonadaceae bacterium]
MNGTLAIVLIVILDITAAAVTLIVANKAANHEIPTFIKGGIGIVCGIVVEVGRIFAARGIVGETLATPGGLLPWLVNLRFVGIPILVGLGFTAGSAAGLAKTTVCPSCKKPINLNIPVMKESAGFAKEYKQPCPSCNTILVYETENFEIISHEPKAEDEGKLANEKDQE